MVRVLTEQRNNGTEEKKIKTTTRERGDTLERLGRLFSSGKSSVVWFLRLRILVESKLSKIKVVVPKIHLRLSPEKFVFIHFNRHFNIICIIIVELENINILIIDQCVYEWMNEWVASMSTRARMNTCVCVCMWIRVMNHILNVQIFKLHIERNSALEHIDGSSGTWIARTDNSTQFKEKPNLIRHNAHINED